MHVGILGAGAVGCYVGGRILASGSGRVTLVGRDRLRRELAATGMRVVELDGSTREVAPEQIDFRLDVEALAGCDVVLCCVKSGDTAEAGESLSEVLPAGASVVSLQNGVRNPELLRAALPDQAVRAGIVAFNVVFVGAGELRRTTSGMIMLEAAGDAVADPLVEVLRRSGVEVELKRDLAPHQWSKLLVNLNNAVSALSGVPTRELLLERSYRLVLAALLSEALRVVRRAGIRTAALQGLPMGAMPFLLRLPTPLLRVLLAAQLRIDAEARSSMYADLARGRRTEVEFLNGEIVRLADSGGEAAPLNRRIVDLVHAAEEEGTGSPGMSAATLWSKLSGAN